MKTIIAAMIGTASLLASSANAQDRPQIPWGDSEAQTGADRLYTADQFSNTVTVIDPVEGKTLGIIKLGELQPANFGALYKGQLLVHGLGFSPDGKTLAVVSVGSNSVTFIDTATNTVKHTTYLGRSPHEAFYTRDGKEVWVTVRGESHIAVLDAKTFEVKKRIDTPEGPGMQIFSIDGKYGFVCSSFTPELVVYDVASHKEVARLEQPSPFCPNLAASPDGKQLWYTLKDIGKVAVINAKPPFDTIKVIDTGAISNHVNFANTDRGLMAYVTIGGLNQVKVFRTDDFRQIATIPVGRLPHGVWPSGDGRRVYVGLENDNRVDVIDTASQRVVGSWPTGHAPQAIAYVPGAVSGNGKANLMPLGDAGNLTRLNLTGTGMTSIALFDQGLVQILEAGVAGLKPGQEYQLILASHPDGTGEVEAIAKFKANPAGGAIVNTTGPIRQIVRGNETATRRYLAIREMADGQPGTVVQTQQD